MAIREGLQSAMDMGFQVIQVESDCNTVVRLIKGEAETLRNELSIVSDICCLALDFRFVSFSFVHRLNNKLTDILVNYGLGLLQRNDNSRDGRKRNFTEIMKN